MRRLPFAVAPSSAASTSRTRCSGVVASRVQDSAEERLRTKQKTSLKALRILRSRSALAVELRAPEHRSQQARSPSPAPVALRKGGRGGRPSALHHARVRVVGTYACTSSAWKTAGASCASACKRASFSDVDQGREPLAASDASAAAIAGRRGEARVAVSTLRESERTRAGQAAVVARREQRVEQARERALLVVGPGRAHLSRTAPRGSA